MSIKTSGLIKPPKKLVADMNDFLCHHITLLLAYGPEHFRERWSEEDIEYLRKSNRFSRSEISGVKDFEGGFFIEEFFELSDYDIKATQMTYGKPLFNKITLAIEHEERQWKTLGHWNPKYSEININSAFFQKVGSEDGLDPKLLCNYIKSTLIHELTHAMQYIMYHEPHSKLKTRGGFPAKLKELPYDIYRRKGDIAYLASKYEDDELEMALHRLTPIEFYPLLLQEILAFRFSYHEQDITPTNADIREYLQDSPFFKYLKELPNVYKKAVGIFVSEVKKSKDEGISYVKKASAHRVAFRYLQAASQPAQDLGGVKTWVDKTRQDQLNNDTSSPDKSREDYEDGKPQRDRVLPLPDGHPKGRDEQRTGPGVINSPPDSSGAGGANRPKKDPSALNDHPDGKALHERPRSSGIPGDEYGNPYIDQSQSTGMKRRVMGSLEETEEYNYWDIDGDSLIKVGLFRYNYRPPTGNKRQRKQKGEAKRKSQKSKRKSRVKYRRNLIKQKRLYKRKKHNSTYIRYKKNYAKNPEKYNRRPGGGVSTTKQKNQRAEKRRK